MGELKMERCCGKMESCFYQYMESGKSYMQYVQEMISSHDIGHGWRFGVCHIRDTYKSDYNIHNLHEQLVEQYVKTKKLLPVYRILVAKESFLSDASKYEVERTFHRTNATRLKDRVYDLECNLTFDLFTQQVWNLAKSYARIGSTRQMLTFAPTAIREGKRKLASPYATCRTWKIKAELSPTEERKERLVERYIAEATKYAWITIVKQGRNGSQVHCCSCDMEMENCEESSSCMLVCPHCFAENPSTFNTCVTRDDMSHIQVKDDSISNFETALRKYMGLQEPPPPELIDRLNAYMKSRNYPAREEVWNMPLDEYSKRGGTSCKMIIEALSNLKEVKHYEDIHLIGAKLWNWKLPDLSACKEQIMYHFKETQRVFNQVSKEDRGRNSALGIQLRLYAHLHAVGHKCRFEDFKIPSSTSSLQIHLNNWRYMCKHSGVPMLINLEDLPTS